MHIKDAYKRMMNINVFFMPIFYLFIQVFCVDLWFEKMCK